MHSGLMITHLTCFLRVMVLKMVKTSSMLTMMTRTNKVMKGV